MSNDRFVAMQLSDQFEALFEMLRQSVERCPDALWEDADLRPAFWHEAYHTLFWCDNFVGDRDKPFEKCPVGVDIDPRLFQEPGKRMEKGELLRLLESARSHVAERLSTMRDRDLAERSTFGELSAEFDFVLHRILYGLRHGQHHVGKLAGRLREGGAEGADWIG